MYSNVASSFIMSFVSPSPTNAANNGNERGGGGGDEHINNVDDGGGRGGSVHGNTALNITAFLKCKFPNMPESSVNATSAGLTGSLDLYHNSFGSGTNSPSASYGTDDWESTGNRDDWTIGSGGKHHGDGEEDFNSNYNNYHRGDSEYHHYNRFHHELSALYSVYEDDDGSGIGAGGGGSLGGTYCPRDWDNILCWPKTAAGEIATLPCFEYFHGISYNASGELVLISLHILCVRYSRNFMASTI